MLEEPLYVHVNEITLEEVGNECSNLHGLPSSEFVPKIKLSLLASKHTFVIYYHSTEESDGFAVVTLATGGEIGTQNSLTPLPAL